jgi:hypothetical protein
MTGRGRASPAPRRAVPGALALALALLLLPSGGSAQSGGVFLDAGLSHSRSPSGSEADPSTYALGGLRARWSPADGRASLFANVYGGLSFEETAGDWGSLGAGGSVWTPVGDRYALSLEARADAFTVGAPFVFRALSGEIRPRASVRIGTAWLSLAGRGAVARSESEVRDVPDQPTGFVPTGEVTSDLWFAGGGPELRVPVGEASLELGGHLYDSDAGGYGQAFAALSGSVGPAVVGVELRVWDTPFEDEVTGGLTVSLPVSSGWTGYAGGRRSSPDPLLQTAPSARGSFVVGRRLAAFGADGAGEPISLYSVERRGEAGRATVRFRIRRPDAERVELLGDFTGWEPAEMERHDGVWRLELRIRPGVHRFGFRVDGEWYVPEEAPGRSRDEWGTPSATLVVEGT